MLEDELKQHAFNNSFLYFMMNISGGGISFPSRQEIPLDSVVALELASPLFPSTIIAIGEVVACEPVARTEGVRYEIGVECRWIGWKEQDVQQEIAHFIINSLESSKAHR